MIILQMVGMHLRLVMVLNMPQISSEEIYGLLRTFPLYVKMPKEYWPQIERAEIFDKEGDKIYNELSEIYHNEYLQ